ncbi:hypothetical protein A21D_02360 [Virgibacillus dokdonensis]|uniref:Uncharacterized protein n=1 Tax=Virgibacillus dokdonensis TaxID=302167 RepID=A0A2K9J135_9BACI|nr:hypothetical protein A21D_02360 [Virgibacillus dokdonensis]
MSEFSTSRSGFRRFAYIIIHKRLYVPIAQKVSPDVTFGLTFLGTREPSPHNAVIAEKTSQHQLKNQEALMM